MFDDLTTGSPTPVGVRWVRTPSRRAPESSGWWWGSPPPAERLVTLSNWQEPPWNRWAFQHVGQLIPSARISRGDGPILELPPTLSPGCSWTRAYWSRTDCWPTACPSSAAPPSRAHHRRANW